MRQRWHLGLFSESELGPISKHLADMVTDTGTVGSGSQILAAEERRNPPPLLPNINTHTRAVPMHADSNGDVCQVHSRHAPPSLQSIIQATTVIIIMVMMVKMMTINGTAVRVGSSAWLQPWFCHYPACNLDKVT